MRCLRPIFLAVLLAVLGRGLTANAGAPVSGEIGGELKLFDRNPEFVLPWQMAFGQKGNSDEEFSYKIDTAGTKLVATGRLNLAKGDGSWRIEECRIDAAVWLALVAPRLGDVLRGTSAQGIFSVTGEGTLHNGEVTGRLKCEWRDGALVNAEQGWKLEGIFFNGEFALDAVALRAISTAPFELKIGNITHPRFGARNLLLQASLTPRFTLRVAAAQIEVAGGDVAGDPCEWPLSPLAVDINLHVRRVGLQDIVYLVPTAGLSDARGKIDGVVRVKWTAERNLHFGLGDLQISDSEPAIVRLSPALGLLTAKVPPSFDILPSWTGPLAKWTRQDLAAYKTLSDIELGKDELQVETLKIHLTPEGDENGRSATVKLVAQPIGPRSAVKKVTFDVNVVGPLNRVLKLGLEQNFSLDAH